MNKSSGTNLLCDSYVTVWKICHYSQDWNRSSLWECCRISLDLCIAVRFCEVGLLTVEKLLEVSTPTSTTLAIKVDGIFVVVVCPLVDLNSFNVLGLAICFPEHGSS